MPLTAQPSSADRATLGFWIYILGDCLLFGAMFATFSVLRGNLFTVSTGTGLFDLTFVLIETLLLLTSSFTIGLAMLAQRRGGKRLLLLAIAATMLLGIAFLVMEFSEFAHLAASGNDWTKSGFLSAFFGLIGTHGAHVLAGVVWMAVLLVQLGMRGITPAFKRRLLCLSLFWHFLDIIWICIFSIVYLMGMLS